MLLSGTDRQTRRVLSGLRPKAAPAVARIGTDVQPCSGTVASAAHAQYVSWPSPARPRIYREKFTPKETAPVTVRNLSGRRGGIRAGKETYRIAFCFFPFLFRSGLPRAAPAYKHRRRASAFCPSPRFFSFLFLCSPLRFR
jgi:hypothetical protein